jgi:hypothetical protein
MRDTNTNKGNEMTNVAHETMFTEAELFGMFNVECADNWASPNSLSVPLLKVKVRKPKANKRVKHTCDKIKAGITTANPGKGRVADLARFYAASGGRGVSALGVQRVPTTLVRGDRAPH